MNTLLRSKPVCSLTIKMNTLHLYREEIRLLSRREAVTERKDLRVMNGDAFFPLKRRPGDIERIFWKEPMDDKEMFKLVLYLVGNGCTP